jgi:hypothetical protein
MLNSARNTPPIAGVTKLAIVAMDVLLPGCDGLGAFERLVISGGQTAPELALLSAGLDAEESAFWALSSAQAASLASEDRLLL